MSRVDRRWLFAGFVALFLCMAGPAIAQLQTGDLYGTVIAEDGSPLPGVTVSVEGVGSPKVQVTDETGQFRFPALYPGTYKVTAELQGYNTLEYPDIGVRVGGKASIEITLSASLAESITVTGEAPLLDERRLNTGANVSAVELDKVPTARDPWSLLSQAPGVLVDRFNLGGNESGQQSAFLGLGASSTENVYAVDGVILTDMNSVGDSATYFDFGAFEEVQFTVSSADVTIATAGVTINQVTKRGTNSWRGQARYLRTDGEAQSDPAVLLRDPSTIGNEIDSVEEYGADVGGPLWKDHLWLWGSYGESDIRNMVGLLGGGQQPDTTQLEDLNVKLNYQAGQQLSGVFHYWNNDKLKFGRGAGPTRVPESTHDQTTPQDIFKVEATWIPTSSFFLTGLWGRDDGIFTLTPQGGLDADIFTDEEGVRRGTNYDFDQEAVIDQARLDASYFFNAGGTNNELKFGAGFREQENHSGTVWPRGKRTEAITDPDFPDDLELVIFPRNRSVGLLTSYESAWIQDTLSMGRWTINAGLRYDKQTGENLASSDPGNAVVPGAGPGEPGLLPPLNFRGNDAGGFEWESVVPRVGVTYALGEERKTLLRGSFSQYAEQLGQYVIGRVNPVSYAYAYFYFTDANRNLLLDPNEIGSLEYSYAYGIDTGNPSALISPNVNDPDFEPTITDELTFGVEHALRTDLAVGLNLIYRNAHEIPEARTLIFDEATGQTRVATREDWVPFRTVTAPLPDGSESSGTVIYDLREGLSPTGGNYFTNGDRELQYRGVTLTLNKRLANRWSFRGHATFADWDWKLGPEFRKYDDPTDTLTDPLGFSDGEEVFFETSGGNKNNVVISSRYSFSLNGLYQVAPDRPWGFNLGASLDGREGYITPPFIRAGADTVGRRNIQLSEIDEFRHDDVMVLNGHLDKDFSFGETRLTLSLDGFNLTGEDVILQRQRNAFTTVETSTGEEIDYYPIEALSPRVFRVGATFRFR
jgi:hypothetical protein